MEIKPCPICGTKATYNKERFADRYGYGNKYGYGVICKRTACLILPAVYNSEDEAAMEWNRRVGNV